MFLLVPAYPGCPGSKAVKRSLLLLLLLLLCITIHYAGGANKGVTITGPKAKAKA